MNQFKKMTLSFLLLLFSACGSKNLDKNIDSADEAIESSNNFTLVRKWQRVIRYHCTGSVQSDGQETILSPKAPVTISPDEYDQFYSSSFKNLTNGAANPAVSNHTIFSIDMAPTVFNLKVEEGLNEIRYEFFYCQNLKKDQAGQPTGECAHVPESKESGSLYIFVIYQQIWLDGVLEIRPDPTTCSESVSY